MKDPFLGSDNKGFMDTFEKSNKNSEMDKKIENIIQKYDKLSSFKMSQNSTKEKSVSYTHLTLPTTPYV